MDGSLVPAAQYLRMPTEHQQYSLENQSHAMKRYADDYGFAVIQTYTDAGKSGIVLRNREGASATSQGRYERTGYVQGNPRL